MNRNGLKAFTLSALCAAMLPVMQANAAGYQVSEHSAAGLGRAFAGEAAMADDASVVARNPAGMSMIDSTTITLVGSYVVPGIHVEDASGSNSGSKKVAGEAFVPAAYMVMPINDQIAVGFGGFTNFGFGTDYGSSFSRLDKADKSEVTSMNFNTSISYKFNEDLSFGFGVNAVHTEAELTSSTPVAAGSQTLMAMKGDDWSWGWNVGALWQATDATRVGLSYRSEVKNTLEGKVKSDVFNGAPGVGGANWNTKGKVDLTLPAIAELSINHDLTDTVSLQASIQRTFWSSFKRIEFDLANGANIPSVEEHWNDVNRYSVGATWNYSNALTLRAGIARDESPVDDYYRTFRIPDTNRMWYTVGGTYALSDNNTVDFAYGYINGGSEDIYEHNDAPVGKIKNSDAHIFSLQYNYRF
ncbi:OmpP1/FadL family transporter [Sansalvadorimonas verongulae]|uniref:OmpP1/FadL family transporter n=1 Tax=Sansalvadorimonas verongulae TaxID=2172824 RepID=UPI0012BCD264|nr:outer membrane protein transport protein [Sansalvadorimonas verongulae]MTI14351.1 long-chain fatty acid transporter [Sansalvadorimonas verongulae]